MVYSLGEVERANGVHWGGLRVGQAEETLYDVLGALDVALQAHQDAPLVDNAGSELYVTMSLEKLLRHQEKAIPIN